MSSVARFDDFWAKKSVLFSDCIEEVVARSSDEVQPKLALVEKRCAEGKWAYGFVAYEAASGFNSTLVTRENDSALPLLWFGISDTPPRIGTVISPVVKPDRNYNIGEWRVEWGAEEHARKVDRVLAEIAAGETYQCNLTSRMHAEFSGDLTELYADLANSQAGAHSAYIHADRFTIVSASPELFFNLQGCDIEMRPMKGTIARGRNLCEDSQLTFRLRTSPKERAENIMIVDLLRNDLSKVARIGSVKASRLCQVERFGTVLQMTSEIRAKLKSTGTIVDIFRALFPCGSITGAPKARTMEIIRDLESSPRGVYCGVIGYMGPGLAKFSVAIRTVVVDRYEAKATFGTGGGITWSSVPSDEYNELLIKSAVLRPRPHGFSLIEIVRFEPSSGFRHLSRHLQRLTESANYFDYEFDPCSLEKTLHDMNMDMSALVSISLDHNGHITVGHLPCPVSNSQEIRLGFDSQPVDSSQPWSWHNTDIRPGRASSVDAEAGLDELIIINEHGEVADTTTANIAILIDGVWATPPLSSGCLPGIEREHLLESGFVRERPVYPSDVVRAASLALISDSHCWQPARLACSAVAH